MNKNLSLSSVTYLNKEESKYLMPRRSVDPSSEIAKALVTLGRASFGDLLKETKLAEPTIARHLETLGVQKLILAERSQKDRRKVLYALNPGELGVITVNEVLESIKKELEAINEELDLEEEKAIRNILVNHIRKQVLDEYLKKEKYKREDALSFILDKLSSLVSVRRGLSLVESNVGSLDGKKQAAMLKEFAKIFKKINPKIKLNADRMAKQMANLIEVVDEIPITFAEKWMGTKYFEESGFASFAGPTLLGFMISPHVAKLLEKMNSEK